MPQVRGESPIRWDESRKSWVCTIDLGRKPNGKRNRKLIHSKDRNALIRARREFVRAIEDGTYSPGRVPTVAVWFEHWLDEIAADRVRPRVLANYRSYGRRHLIHIGARKIDVLTPDDIRFMHEKMREGGASPRTIRAVHDTLAASLKDAVREGVISMSACDRMARPRATVQNPREAFTGFEVQAILTTAEGDGPKWFSRWAMALMLGARQGECLGLEWERVNLASGFIDLSWQVQRIPWKHGDGCACGDGVGAVSCPSRVPDIPEGMEVRPCYKGIWFTRPKTAAGVRMLPIPRPLLAALREYAEQLGGSPKGLVWGCAGGRPVRVADDEAAWRELCRRAGVRSLSLHSARHTWVSTLMENGVSPEVIIQMAGHSSFLSTRNYLHVSASAARKALEVW